MEYKLTKDQQNLINAAMQKDAKDYFPQPVLDVLIGTILGDGGMYINNALTIASYRFSQALVRIEYANFVMRAFGIYTLGRELKHAQSVNADSGKVHYSVYFTTLSFPELLIIFLIFYEYNSETGKWVKVVPLNIAEYLTPQALAYWIMDDGTLNPNGGVTLCTDAFTYVEVLNLKAAIEINFGYTCTLHKRAGGKHRIYISRKNLPDMQEKLSKHFHPSLLRKLYN